MPHHLMNRHASSAIMNPLMVTMRYSCECANGEVVTINVVVDKDMPDEAFAWTMRTMLKDMRIEIDQHVKRPAAKGAA